MSNNPMGTPTAAQVARAARATEEDTTTTPPKPTPVEVREAREAAGLTQREAAELVYLGHAKRWSEIERGVQTMHAAVWELFCIKIEPLVRAASKVKAAA